MAPVFQIQQDIPSINHFLYKIMDNTVLYHYFTATAVYGSMFLLVRTFGRLIRGVRVLRVETNGFTLT